VLNNLREGVYCEMEGNKRPEPELPPMSSIKPQSKISTYSSVFEGCFREPHSQSTFLSLDDRSDVLDGAFYIDRVLSNRECALLCSQCDQCEDMKFWSSAGRDDFQARAFRDADTVEVKSNYISSTIWSRMNHLLPMRRIVVPDDVEDINHERELVGEWEAVAVNSNLLFAKYPCGGSFAPHTDGRAIEDFNTRSFYSVVLFLNTIPDGSGGGTKFYTKSATSQLVMTESNRWTSVAEFSLGEVVPRAGRMLVFHQSLVHEGVPPSQPYFKYIIRTDIMYKRNPAICTSPRDIEAYEMFRQAEDLAERGENNDAVVMFRRAFKLSPDLARIMGQG
jgi:2OG-Fe(II) oxygenase superfamily